MTNLQQISLSSVNVYTTNIRVRLNSYTRLCKVTDRRTTWH